MADTRNTSESGGHAKGSTPAVANERSGQGLQRSEHHGLSPFSNPFELFDRMRDEMDRLFFGSYLTPRSRWGAGPRTAETWAPKIEAFQEGNNFIVRADLPGLKKDDVDVELGEDTLTIRGERHSEREEKREGYFHTEREYGRFYRTIPLPEGVIGESAEAKFKDGVLEITMQAPPSEVSRKRKVEIKEK